MSIPLPEIKPLQDLRTQGIKLSNTLPKALPALPGKMNIKASRQQEAELYNLEVKEAFKATRRQRAVEKAKARREERFTERYAKNLGKR